jgi:multicomponent Na+:H+ antiporter subunit G
MNDIQHIIGYAFVVIGLGFDVLGCVGLIRLPDAYNRLHATTKCITLGTCAILLGTFILKGLCITGVKAIICAVFILAISPVVGHALARSSHKAGVKLCEKSAIDKYKEDGN